MKNLHKLLISAVISLILPILPSSLHANEIFKRLNINNGLAHTDACCILQDSTGLIWIGTLAGLQNYDGYNLQTFDYYPKNHKIYESHNRIRAMACNTDKIWLGTESGLTCFDLNTHRYIPYHIEGDELSQRLRSTVHEIFINPAGCHLWIRTSKEAIIAQVHKDTLKSVEWNNDADRIFCKGITDLQFQGETVWASTGFHLVKLGIRNGQIVLLNSYATDKLLKKNDIIRSIHLMGNYLYVRSGEGCHRFNIAGGQPECSTSVYTGFHQVNPRIPTTTNGKLIVSKEGDLWCTYSAGIFEMKQPFSSQAVIREYLRNTPDEEHSSLKIEDLLIDKYNNLWVASNSWGIFYRSLSKSIFSNLSAPDFQEMGFSQNEVVSITGQDNGTNWILVEYSSLFRHSPQTGELTLMPLQKTKNAETIYYQTLEMSRDQRHLYIGTSHGIFLYDTYTQKSRKLDSKNSGDANLINISIAHLKEDSSGHLWIGTWGNGIFRISNPLSAPKITMHLNTQTDPCLLSNHISHILVKGHSTFLCTTNGLNRLQLTDDGRIKNLSSYQADSSMKNSMSTNYLADIDCSNDSICWVGTIGGGLNKIVLHSERNNDYTATCYTVQDGLPNNDCEIVLLDHKGNVWTGGKGITQLNPQKNTIHTYGLGDGLQNNAFKINASYKGNDGYLYMGGLYGLSYFHPSHLICSTGNNELMLCGLTVNNQKIVPKAAYNGRILLDKVLDKTSKLTLNYLQNNFTISFAALGYELSEQIMYRYRLKGFQQEWHTLRYTNNEVYFSNLPYDSYELEVQFSTDKGYTWQEPVKKLEINVLPPWWLSFQAKVSYVLIVLLVLYIAFRQYSKEQNLKKENEIQKILMAQDEEKYQAKMQFFMNASHELKTPLTLILLAAEKLFNDNKPVKECKTILTNAKKMLALITELVDIRKADLGIGTLNIEHLNMSQLVRRIFDEISSWANNKHISATFTADAEDIELDADKDKMGKMIINLLSNAIKYTNEDGKVDVHFKKGTMKDVTPCYGNLHTEGNISPEQPVCILTVRDTGVGISTESIRLIYERFFQVQGSSQSHLGSGIGLAIVKSIVLQHNGMIIVSSERMVGTEFIVALPISGSNPITGKGENSDFDFKGFMNNQYCELDTNETNNIKEPESPRSDNPKLPTLLIVEDNKELQTALREQLSSSYNIHTADNGRMGLDMCMSIFPDIIVSDVMMPEMDGIEMCRRIKNNLSVAYIPLVLLTAKDNVESQIEGYESGADLYIPKPFSMKLLEVNLHRLLTQREQWLKGNRPDNAIQASPDYIRNTTAEETAAEKKTAKKEPQKSALSAEELQTMTEQFKKVINDNLSDPNLSPDQLAAAMGVSRTKLYRDLKRIDGQSLADYVRNVRLEKAAYLLTNSNLNIQEIMLEVGFINNSHFTKTFKLKFEMSPTEYKKNICRE